MRSRGVPCRVGGLLVASVGIGGAGIQAASGLHSASLDVPAPGGMLPTLHTP